MDAKTLNSKISQRMGIDSSQASMLLNSLVAVMRDRAANLDSIAIPGFGNFVSVKLPEKVVVNPETGKSVLNPPQIKLEFIASAMLKKQVLS